MERTRGIRFFMPFDDVTAPTVRRDLDSASVTMWRTR